MHPLSLILVGMLTFFGAAWSGSFTRPASQSQSVVELAEANSLNFQIGNLFSEGKYDEAFRLAKRVLELRERNLPPDDERIALSLINLGEICDARKKPAEAQPFFERALALYEKKLGVGDTKVAAVLDRLAAIYFSRNNYPESERALQRSLKIKEGVYGGNSVNVATALDALAQFYRYRGDANKAEPLFERALEIMAKTLPPDSPARSKTRDHYFCLLNEFRRTDKLRELERKSTEQAAAAAALATEIGGGVLNGKAIKLPQPAYPAAASNARVEGVVVVSVRIDETGKVVEAHDLCGANPLLIKVSLEAARKAEFTPTKLSGQPVKVIGVIVYNFVAR